MSDDARLPDAAVLDALREVERRLPRLADPMRAVMVLDLDGEPFTYDAFRKAAESLGQRMPSPALLEYLRHRRFP